MTMRTQAVLEEMRTDRDAVPVITVATDADGPAWDRFVEAHPDSTGYHLWAWRHVFWRTFGHESIYLAAWQRDRIVGVVPLVHIRSRVFGRTLVSLPFLNYGGVLADADSVAETLQEAAAEHARSRHCRHVEFRHVRRRFAQLPCRQHKVAMLRRLETGLWDQLDRKVRNQVRKAQKSGLTVERGGSELVGDFYRVFARNMRDLGTPVYSRRLFEEVIGTLPDRARVHVVRLAGKPVAAGLTYRFRTTIEVPWASSVRDYNSLCPNHLLYWDVMETAFAAGCQVLDFGRSTPGEGTYKFKEQWGAKPVALHWEYRLVEGTALPNVGPANPKFRLAIGAWKKLPLAVATTLGPHIVRGIP
jgi:serine/alanine adding enzyme